MKNGFAVLAPDLIWTGETGPGSFKGDADIGNVSFNVWFESILIGRSIVGIQAGDVARCVRYLESREDIDFKNISAVAWKEMCPALLHAAAFEDSIRKIALIEPLSSYRLIVMNRYYNPRLIPATVAGSLTAYDLPDIAACLAWTGQSRVHYGTEPHWRDRARPLLMVNVTDGNGDRARSDVIEKDLAVIRSAYSAARAKKKLEIRSWEAEQKLDEIFSSWFKQ